MYNLYDNLPDCRSLSHPLDSWPIVSYNLTMSRGFTYKKVRSVKIANRGSRNMDDDEELSYKAIPVLPERDKGGLNAIELMSLYEKLIKENAFLRDRVLRLEQRLMDVLN